MSFISTYGNQNVLKDINNIDWSDPTQLIDQECQHCSALKICKTCYGYNYSQRKHISRRDKGMCHLRLIEAQTISEFQIRYYTKKEQLTNYELLSLKAAVECYKHIKDLYFNKNKIGGYIPPSIN